MWRCYITCPGSPTYLEALSLEYQLLAPVLGSALPIAGEHLAIPGDIFDCHTWGGIPGIWWVGSRDASKHPAMPKKIPYSEELSGLKCGQY